MPEDRLEPMALELNGILNWIEQLNEVDVDGVEPMTSVVETTLPMREDKVTDGNIPDKVLANAPYAEDGFFVSRKSSSRSDDVDDRVVEPQACPTW